MNYNAPFKKYIWPEGTAYTDKRMREYVENPQLSYGTKCRDQYRANFGKEYEGEMEGELGYAEINN